MSFIVDDSVTFTVKNPDVAQPISVAKVLILLASLIGGVGAGYVVVRGVKK